MCTSERERLTGNEVAALFHTSRQTIYEWVAAGRFPSQEHWTMAGLNHLIGKNLKRPSRWSGPDPKSKRYRLGGHTFKPKT